jgi:DNA-binding transcriptional ArsR family regulator
VNNGELAFIHVLVNIPKFVDKVKVMPRKTSKSPKKRPGKGLGSTLSPPEIPEIPEVFRLTRVEQLRSISVPLRMSILRVLAEKPMTTKQVALQLREPITKLYRHVDALAEAGLIVLVAEVPKRGTVQKFYRAAAQSYKADDSCFPAAKHQDARVQAMFDVLDATRQAIVANARRASPGFLSLAASSEVELADPAQAADLMETLTKSLQAWTKKHEVRGSRKGAASYRIALFLNPANKGK